MPAAVLCAVALAGADGCGCGAATDPPAQPGPVPSWLARPYAEPSAAARPPVEALPARVVDPAAAVFDPERIAAVLDDPRLAAVKQAALRQAWVRAQEELQAAMRAAEKAGQPWEEPAWSYQLGLLRSRAGDPLGAVLAFDRAAAADWPLSDYARLEAADLLVQAGEPAEALARLGGIRAELAADGEIDLLRARALADSGEVDRAAEIWEPYLARRPRSSGWQLVALRFARALLRQPSEARAERAVQVARLVIFQSPAGRGVGEARELEEQALSAIPSQRRRRLKDVERAELVAQARALADAGQPREALAATVRLAAHFTGKGPSELGCETFLARAKALGALGRYGEASEQYGLAMAQCAGTPRRAQALFLGARSALRGGQPAEARRRYALVEEEFPAHSLADDARLHGAEAARKLGDEAGFVRALGRIADDYPQGDMVDQGLFVLALDRIEKGDWAGALAPLERAAQRLGRGRPERADAEARARYFLARARIALGSADDGAALLAQVVRDFPLSFYMVLAYNRLRERDPAAAERVLADALAAEPGGSFVIPDSEPLHAPGFERAIELVRQGEATGALAELDRLGVRDGSADPSLLWAGAFLLARVEAAAESHDLLRSTTRLWTEHYPAGIWQRIWRLAYPRAHQDLVRQQAARFGVSELLAYAVMREESAFRPQAVSAAGAVGLMQLMEPTAERLARPLGLPWRRAALERPEINIALGCRYLSLLRRDFAGSPLLAIPAYNAGPGAPARWRRERPSDDFDVFIESIPYRETRRYTQQVIASLAAYAVLYGDGMRSELLRVPLKVGPP